MDRPSWWPQHVARLTYMLTTRTAPIVRPRLDVLRAATGEPGAATGRSDSAIGAAELVKQAGPWPATVAL
jgi:hypothetical protein